MTEKEMINQDSLGPVDEEWWAAVMSEEESNGRPQQPPRNAETEKVKPEEKPVEDQNDWGYVMALMSDDKVIECEVTEFNRGGLLVSNDRFKGFVPVSHLVDVKVLKEEKKRNQLLKKYIGRKLSLKVIECEPNRGRIVLSERAAQSAPGERHRLFDSLEMNTVATGRVTNVTDFGVFVDLGGVEGLAHISELSWTRVDHPSSFYQIGQEIEVLVLNVDKEKGRVSLSMKRLLSNPWESVQERYPSGTSFPVTVIKVVQYGAFVQLEDGLEGLIHVTEMGLLDEDTPADILKAGETVYVEIITVDIEHQRLSLRLRE